MISILLIEPDAALAAVYKTALTSSDMSVVLAMHAADAIAAADTKTPDLVLLELQLAGHSGVEFLYEFRSYAEWQMTPIILLTNVNQRALALSPQQQTSLGIARYLYKPSTSLHQLQTTVKETLSL